MKNLIMALTTVLTITLAVAAQDDVVIEDAGQTAIQEAIDAAQQSIDEAESAVSGDIVQDETLETHPAALQIELTETDTGDTYTAVVQEQDETQESLSDLGQDIVEDAIGQEELTLTPEAADVFTNPGEIVSDSNDSYFGDTYMGESVVAPGYDSGNDSFAAPVDSYMSAPMGAPIYNAGIGCGIPVVDMCNSCGSFGYGYSSACKPACPNPCSSVRGSRTRAHRPVRNLLSRLRLRRR